MIKYQRPASIECEVAKLKYRKIVIQKPEKNTKLNKIVYRCKCERDSEAYIVKELNPKIPKINENSMLNKDDGIKGKDIFVISIKNIRPENAKIKRGSATHQAAFHQLRGFIYAELELEFPNLTNILLAIQ